MDPPDNGVTLVTIRVRRDVDFTDGLFISLRSYSIDERSEPRHTAEVTTIESAVGVVEGWLEDLTSAL